MAFVTWRSCLALRAVTDDGLRCVLFQERTRGCIQFIRRCWTCRTVFASPTPTTLVVHRWNELNGSRSESHFPSVLSCNTPHRSYRIRPIALSTRTGMPACSNFIWLQCFIYAEHADHSAVPVLKVFHESFYLKAQFSTVIFQ